jgi:ubiquinone/menaquinone biosynthesis C-methylase UbiE
VKSTRPFYARLSEADIQGIDLAAPCLKLAARTAAEAGARNVRFRQADARDTGCADASFDLVTSTMLLHEMPPPAVERTLAEAARVLKPGGKMVHLDFLPQAQPRGDAFARFIHAGHGRRNNEPFMAPLAEMDLARLLERLGFANVEIRAFEEADGTLAPDYAGWRFPWTVIIAEKRADTGAR